MAEKAGRVHVQLSLQVERRRPHRSQAGLPAESTRAAGQAETSGAPAQQHARHTEAWNREGESGAQECRRYACELSPAGTAAGSGSATSSAASAAAPGSTAAGSTALSSSSMLVCSAGVGGVCCDMVRGPGGCEASAAADSVDLVQHGVTPLLCVLASQSPSTIRKTQTQHTHSLPTIRKSSCFLGAL
jgi:hypothetical protein